MCYNVLRGDDFMPHVSLRVTEQEKIWMDSYAKLRGVKLSDAIKEAFFIKLEDEYDLKTIRMYEVEKEQGNIEYHTRADVRNMLGLE